MIQSLPTNHALSTKILPQPILAQKVSIQNQTFDCADPKAIRALIALMDMCAVTGGAAAHWGGPAAFAEINSALFALIFSEAKTQNLKWNQLFHFVNDAGHCENGLYAIKALYGLADLKLTDLLEFRGIQSKLTGHGEAHLFPEAVYLSNGPLGSAFGQAQGLCLADRLTEKKRTTILTASDGACMEGEAREVLASLPGMASKGQLNPFVLVVSDNNTKLSGRIDQDSFSMQPTFASIKEQGWDVRSVERGHDLAALLSSFESAFRDANQNPKKPILVRVKTVKGFSVQKTAESSSGGHGFPLKKATELEAFLSEIYSGQALPTQILELLKLTLERKSGTARAQHFGKEDKIQVGVSSALIEAARAGLPVVSITSDLPGSTGVAGFRKEFPQFSLDVGVAEANMISVGAGLSKEGFIPVVDTFAQFGVTKGALPLTMASLSMAPVIGIFSHTGFQDAADGASHQALSYVAMVASIPHVRVIALTCAREAHDLVLQTVQEFADLRRNGKTPPSTIFFLGRENFPIDPCPEVKFKLGQAHVLKTAKAESQKKVCLVAAGSLVIEALAAARVLSEKGIEASVVNPSCLNAMEWGPIQEQIIRCDHNLVVVEDHQLIGGLNHAVGFEVARAGLKCKLRSLAVHGEFGQSAYSAWDLYARHKIDSAAIVEAAESFFRS